MRVLVVGGGAIGGITAAKLAAAGVDVTVLDANAEHAARMNDPGLIFEERGVEITQRIPAVATLDALDGAFDLALIAVKSPYHRAALEPLTARGGIEAYVTLGNGLIQDRIEQLVGPGNLLACLVEWGAVNAGPGRLIRDTVAPMIVGELDGAVRDRTQQAARALEAVGEAHVSTNIRGQIWSKLLVNTAFTGLSAVSGLRYGAVAQHPDGRTVAAGIWAEGLKVGTAERLTLEPVLGVDPHRLDIDKLMEVAGPTKPSMLQDLEAGRATEVDVVNGGVAGRAGEHGIPTPLNDGVVALVHAMERGERAPSPDALTELARL